MIHSLVHAIIYALCMNCLIFMQLMIGLIHLYFLQLSTDIHTFFVKFCRASIYFQNLAEKKLYKLYLIFFNILLEYHLKF